MQNYPEIHRRDGTLFFSCPETSKAAIATSIERLIDMLDAMEDDPDLEPYLAGDAPEGGDDREGDLDIYEGDGRVDDEPILGARESFEQSDWYRPSVGPDERQDDGDDLEPDVDEEPTLAWQNEGSQGDLSVGAFSNEESEPLLGWCGNGTGWQAGESLEEGEPELGWCGNGIGWRESDGSDDREGDDEKDWDAGCPSGGDHGIADLDALASEEWSFSGWSGDNSGADIAADLIRGLPIAASRAAAYSAIHR